MSLVSSPFFLAKGVTAQEGQSLRFEDGDTAYLSFTPASAGNRKTWTFSCWVKRGNLGTAQYILGTPSADSFLAFVSTNTLYFRFDSSGSRELITSAVYRDSGAWYHILISSDTTQATSSDRMSMYVNGVKITDFSTSTYPTLNMEGSINNTVQHNIGVSGAVSGPFDGYIANVAFIDGTALDPTSFGEYDGTLWKPKSDTAIQSLTFGTNGFYLPFKQTTEAEGFSTVTYTGNGSTQDIEGVGFEPDLVWIKKRNNVASHVLQDAVRGTFRYLVPNDTLAENTSSANDWFKSFNSNGFTVSKNSTGGVDTTEWNNSGDTYVAWCWDAGSGSAASNTDGSITSTVKANTAKGFSIVSYTGNGTAGATVGHGLSSAPEMYIVKIRSGFSGGTNWRVYHSALGATKNIILNSTGAAVSETNKWNDTAPTSSVFSLGDHVSVNENNATAIAYCFHSVSGYSSIGSYSGTGATGNSITGLGFKPAWVIIKETGNAGSWHIYDNTRNPVNPASYLLADTSNTEDAFGAYDVDFDSDGFTIQNTGNGTNRSGGTYIYMAFADTRDATFFGDTSGNSNNWTPNALNNTDVVLDSPVTGGNFATLNPLTNSGGTFTEGNLQFTGGSSTRKYLGTTGVSTGKWYWEVKILNAPETRSSTSQYNSFGFSLASSVNVTTMTGDTEALTFADSGYYRNFSGSWTDGGTTITSGDILACAVDLDAGTFAFKRNNTDIVTGNIDSTADGKVLSPHQASYSGTYGKMFCNFGQDSSFAGNTTPQGNTDDNGVGDFYYAPPSGYLALTTGNLPTPTITAPDEYFNTVLYTGDGTTSRSITGIGFQPDFVWLKERSSTSFHQLLDSVRGAGIRLESNSTGAETTPSPVGLSSFDTDGFTVENNNAYNQSSQTYVAWNWLANGTGVSNTDGSITSTVSANTDAGFSIVSYTGTGSAATVGHGLSQKPDVVLIKDRDATNNWQFNTDVIDGSYDYLYLNTTAAKGDHSISAPTSSVFNLGTGAIPNTSGNNYIAYCFHSVEGYSKIGSYTGNGSSDGPFVHCGFRPAWIMIKQYSASGEHWEISDVERGPYNLNTRNLYANLSNAEGGNAARYDVLSNGFKIRTTNAGVNASGGGYIFLAFAEAPFKSANAR